jgi:hypothetical protein
MRSMTMLATSPPILGPQGTETYRRHDASRAATPAATDGEDAHDKLGSGAKECDDIGQKHPLCHVPIHGQGLLEVIW